jgi:hypothetical protein
MIPTPGRIVQYTLAPYDCEQINRRRNDAARNKDGAPGFILHTGNTLGVGDNYPMVITRVWDEVPREDSMVNGQVLLDGNDTLWVTSVQQGDGQRYFREYPRV